MKKSARACAVLVLCVLLSSIFFVTKGDCAESAPNFTLQNLSNASFTLSSYKEKQPVVLFFFTSWCPFCRKELGTLKMLYPKFIKDGVELFAIDVGEQSAKVENAVKNYGLVFQVLLDKDTHVSESYGVMGVPTYVLIDKRGKIVAQDNGFPQEKYQQLIAK